MLLGFAVGLVAANAFEWTVHKYVLHDLGKKKGSYWSFHWHDHHKNVRRNGMVDPMYRQSIFRTPVKVKEALGIVSGAALTTPLLPLAPGFVLAGWASAGAYYYVHKKSHLDPAWAKKWVPWHVDHHLGPNQHKNWCVTWPLWDWVMGTREAWVGTAAERAQTERAAAKAQARAVATPVAAAAPAVAA